MDRNTMRSFACRGRGVPKRRALAAATAAGLAALAGTRAASADTLYWDPGASGNGSWDTTTPNWATAVTTGSPTIAWPNTGADNAFFSNAAVTNSNASAYTVTLGAPIVAASIEFNTASAVTVSGSGANTLTLGTGGVTVDAINTSNGAGYNLSTPLTLAGSQTWTNNSTVNALTAAAINSSAGATLTLSGAGAFNLNGAITDGSGGVTALVIATGSSNAVSLGAANTFTGGLTVNQGLVFTYSAGNNLADTALGAGTVTLGAAGLSATVDLRLRSGVYANPIVLATGDTGTVQIDTLGASSPVLSGSITGTNNLKLTESSTGGLTVNGGINNAGTLSFANNGTSSGYIFANGSIGSNVTGVTVNGVGLTAVYFGTSNAYKGTTTIASGSGPLQIENAAGLGTSTVSIPKAGTALGTLQLNLTGTNTTNNAFAGFNSSTFNTSNASANVADIENVAGNNTITAALTVTGTGGNGLIVQSDAGLLTLSGPVSTTIASRGFLFDGAGNGIVSGVVSQNGSNAAVLDKIGTGTWTLTGANTYTGTTSVYQGTLALGDGGTFGTGTVADAATVAFTNGGGLTVANLISGAGVVTQTGAGTTSLTHANTYSGGTNVSGGTLRANGTAALGTGPVAVLTGVLAGTGTTGTGTVTVTAGGTVTAGTGATPADTPGTLHMPTLALSGGTDLAKVTTIDPAVAANNVNDVLIVSGLTASGVSTVTLQPTSGSTPTFTVSNPLPTTTPAAGSYLVLIDDTDATSANPFNTSNNAAVLAQLALTNNGVLPVTGQSVSLETTADASGTGFDLIAEDVAAPEPASLLLLALTAGPLTLGRRRRPGGRIA